MVLGGPMNNKCILLVALLFLLPFVQNASAAANTLIATPITNTIIDLGQTTTLNTIISAGNTPYTGNWAWTAPNTLTSGGLIGNTIIGNIFLGGLWNSFLTMNTVSPYNVIFTFTSNNYAVNTVPPGTIFGYWTFKANVVDGSTNANAVTVSGNVFVANTPTVTAPIPSNVLLDAGQYVVYNTILTGGVGPFTVNLVNVGTGAVVNTVNNVFASTITFGANIPAQGSPSFNVNAVDLGTTARFTFNSASNTITVYTALGGNALSSSLPTINQGQTEVLTGTVANGAPSYTYNFMVVNTVNGNIVASSVVSNSATSNTFTFLIPSTANAFGPLSANLIVTDSATTNMVTVTHNTITVYSALAFALTMNTALVGLSNSVVYGNTVIANAVVSGGSGSYAFAWTINNQNAANTIVGTTGSSNTFLLPAVGTYTYNVIATDSGTSAQSTASNVLIIRTNYSLLNSAVTYTRALSGDGTVTSTTNATASYQSGYYDTATIAFNGLSGINSQTPAWNVYLNGALASTSSTYQFSETAHPGTYTFVFSNAGNTNYTADSFTITLGVSQLSSGGGGPGISPYPVVTTTATTTTVVTTTSIPVISIGGQSGSSSFNVSPSTPLTVDITGMQASVMLSTSSGGKSGVSFTASNATSSSPSAPAGQTKLVALNITILTAANVTAVATLPYPCGIPSDSVSPYILKNSTWHAISQFTVNAASCTVTFTVPNDPVVGLFASTAAITTSISTTLPTTLPTTVPTTVPAGQPLSGSSSTLIIAVVVIVVIAVAAYAALRARGRSRGWPKAGR